MAEPGGARREAVAGGAPANAGTVLVVDDSAVNRTVLTDRVEALGHRVVQASGGQEALDRLAEGTIDVLLLDIMMPGLTGFDVLERMQADPILHDIPVIVVSALNDPASVIRSIELGAADHLPKPFDPVLLRARLNACLDRKRLCDREIEHRRQIEFEKHRYEELMHVLFPHAVVEELKATQRVQPRRYEDVAVLFSDIVGFTQFSERRDPEEVVDHLQELIEMFEDLALAHGLEKTKTIGDAFMATGGLLQPLPNPVLSCVRCGLRMIAGAAALPAGWQVRIGIHIGPVLAGVVGRRQYLFDLWGDTVNTAARIESAGVPGAVVVSAAAWERIADICEGESQGEISLKGRAPLELFRIDRAGD